MTNLLFAMLALTRVGQSMSIVAFPDNKEVVLGIMANICPMLGEFNTPLGPEGNLRSVFLWSVVCPVLERTAVALNDRAAERLGLTIQEKRSGRDYQLRRNDAGGSTPDTWAQPERRLPFWMQLAARGAAWRKGRAARWNRRTSEKSKRPNLMQLLLQPFNRIAAAL